jgi:hypothetical protein
VGVNKNRVMTIQDIQTLPTKEEQIKVIRELLNSNQISKDAYKSLIFRFS